MKLRFIFAISLIIFFHCYSALTTIIGIEERKSHEISDQFRSNYSLIAEEYAPSSSGWKHAESRYFIFHYSLKSHLIKMEKEATFYLKIISKDLGLKKIPEGPKFHVWLFKNDKTWNNYIYQLKMKNIAGFAPHNRREFFASFAHLGRPGSGLFAHELTHVLLGHAYGKSIPLWFNEGFSEYEADEAYARFKRVKVSSTYQDIPSIQSIFSLSQILEYKQYPENSKEQPYAKTLFYLQSEVLIRDLIQQGGLKKLFQFLIEMQKGKSFSEIYEKSYRYDYEQFRDRYHGTVHQILD